MAFDPMEKVLVSPQHSAVVRALGLGQVIPGEVIAPGKAATVFGIVGTPGGTKSGQIRILVRPAQPRIVSGPEGIEAEVVSLELHPAETREVRRVAVVQVGENVLRLFVRERALAVGERVRVQIDGECETVDG